MMKIAIDGPSGAGKSTIAKAVAKELGWIYVDTGAMYRAAGLAALRKNIRIGEQWDLVEEMMPGLVIRLSYEDGVQKIYLADEDVSEKIRTPEVSIAASDISAIPGVRKALLGKQQDIAKENNVVMDGRDIGTVVLPDAQIKLFITASPEERADRRCKELLVRGQKVSFDQVLQDMKYRDAQDSNRAQAPLKLADDAILVDTTELGFNQAFNQVMSLIRKRLPISEHITTS